jgi:hypothetical protein
MIMTVNAVQFDCGAAFSIRHVAWWIQPLAVTNVTSWVGQSDMDVDGSRSCTQPTLTIDVRKATLVEQNHIASFVEIRGVSALSCTLHR